jgi:CRISPR/Cas system-associated protein Cas10 (large subunit of type III CRISPR-Cas system)
MKLTRNKIRKIRKQVHQSVRTWTKARNSIQRKVLTFRQTPLDLVPKRKNVFNKTLKKYIPLPVLYYLKQKYIEMRRLRRKHRKEQKMMGGKGVKSDVLISDPNVTAIAISAIAKGKE